VALALLAAPAQAATLTALWRKNGLESLFH